MMKFRHGQQGIAMVTAIVAAVVVSITAAVVLNLTFRRFEMSAFRSDHVVAAAEAEAGLQYAFARLGLDAAFRTAVQNARQGAAQRYYVISCRQDLEPNTPGVQAPDAHVPALHMGGKHVTVRIIFGGGLGLPAGEAPLPAGARYRVRAFADFGTGEA
jgi:hypothetical protein